MPICKTEPFGGRFTLNTCIADQDTTEAVVRDPSGAYVGMVSLYRRPRRLIMQTVEIAREHRGGGLGTKLYEWALAIACRERRTLASATMRSHFSEAFWRKQVKRGRARCDTGYTGEGTLWTGPRAELENALDEGEITQTQFDRAVARLPKAGPGGSWRCPRFVMRKDVCKSAARTLGKARP